MTTIKKLIKINLVLVTHFMILIGLIGCGESEEKQMREDLTNISNNLDKWDSLSAIDKTQTIANCSVISVALESNVPESLQTLHKETKDKCATTAKLETVLGTTPAN